MFANTTRNQHFLTQSEQRLNAANPAADEKNLRIFSYRLIDREAFQIELESPKGRRIGESLAWTDLFSFDVPAGGAIRHNFEALFQQYEGNVASQTESLLQKIASRSTNIKDELVDVFVAKFLNFVRNPFSVVKVINTFPQLSSYNPTDPELLAAYTQIATGRKPHQAHLCRELGISDEQYEDWLRILFMLLARTAGSKPNLFEELVKRLLEDQTRHIAVFVCTYDDAYCLLSDRGYSQPLPDGDRLSFSFNLSSHAFVHYVFQDPRELIARTPSPERFEQALRGWQRRPRSSINLTALHNNLTLLAQYNRRVVEQCYQRVYCASRDGVILADLTS